MTNELIKDKWTEYALITVVGLTVINAVLALANVAIPFLSMFALIATLITSMAIPLLNRMWEKWNLNQSVMLAVLGAVVLFASTISGNAASATGLSAVYIAAISPLLSGIGLAALVLGSLGGLRALVK